MKVTFGPTIKDKIYLTPQYPEWHAQTIAGGRDLELETDTYIDLSPFKEIYVRIYSYLPSKDGEIIYYYDQLLVTFDKRYDLHKPEEMTQYIIKRYSREGTKAKYAYFFTQEKLWMRRCTKEIYQAESLHEGYKHG